MVVVGNGFDPIGILESHQGMLDGTGWNGDSGADSSIHTVTQRHRAV